MFDTVMQRCADPRLLGRAFGISDAVVRTAMIGSIALAPSPIDWPTRTRSC
jgi:hypothetical protein